jgi:Trk K+ transport system NAD-binding subunit
LHALGIRIVEQLHVSGTDVVVVDDDPDRRLLGLLQDWGVEFVRGSPRLPAVLVGAGALHAAAVICVEGDDLRALESALVAHDLRPDLRVVAQVANPSVAHALSTIIGAGHVLDVASLAAPSLVQACLAEQSHDLLLEGVAFGVRDDVCAKTGTLRNLYGDLVPLAVVRSGTTDVEICPGRDERVTPGDVVTMLGTPSELGDAGLDSSVHAPGVNGTVGRRTPLQILKWLWSELPWSLRLAFAAIIALAAVSTAVLHAGYHQADDKHLSVLNSLYFTVETISTVGFGDFDFSGQATWLRVFGIGLIILGAASVTTLFALITSTLFSRSIANAFGQQRITRMQRHIVIVGLGAVGVRVLEGLLARGRQVVAIERDEHNRHLAQARALGVPVLIGDSTQTSTLDDANTQAAAAVAALTSSDLTNLETGLVVRQYLHDADKKNVPVVLRVFDRDLSQNIQHNFAFPSVRSTSALAAPWFVGAALGLGILSTFYVEQQLFLIARLTVGEHSGLVDLTMQELSARIRVIAIGRAPVPADPDHNGDRTEQVDHAEGMGGARVGHLEHPVRRDARFAPGDEAYLIGPHEELLTVLRRDSATTVDLA